MCGDICVCGGYAHCFDEGDHVRGGPLEGVIRERAEGEQLEDLGLGGNVAGGHGSLQQLQTICDTLWGDDRRSHSRHMYGQSYLTIHREG